MENENENLTQDMNELDEQNKEEDYWLLLEQKKLKTINDSILMK